ncbi:hypothetical protein C8A00DRAFT_34870 [Chaetomidium leptoderma]|uniref:Uncharacterized protein n=1 Tax=Chaetomidium leptoderma TaxID=669021 RepID=A0AAN6VJH5_9PEZI|nr:hypothetical protein C8A00DRAFT_34870 [Chaetomidium leptoderma]
MRFVTVIAVLAGAASALPGPIPQPDAPATLEPRDCVNCLTYCCSTHGNCNYMNCAGSYCKTNAAGHSYCECTCRYG